MVDIASMEDTANTKEVMDMENMEHLTKLISVIIPVYNCEAFIERTVQDIIEQTYANYELILVDDGSTDRSGIICDQLSELDNRIQVVHQKNGGPSKARNMGISRANGKYIRFVDSDDRVPKRSLEELVAPYLEDNTIDLVMGILGNDRGLWQSELDGKYSVQGMSDDIAKSIHGFYYGHCCNKLYKTDIIVDNGIAFPEDIRWCEDYLFNLEYFMKIEKNVYYSKSESYQYLTRENSLVSNVPITIRNEVEDRCLEKLEIFITQDKMKESEKLRNAYQDHYAFLKHSQMCNLCCCQSGYSVIKRQCLNDKDLKFWKNYKNRNGIKAYGIIGFLSKAHCGYGIYTYILIKEKFKTKHQDFVKKRKVTAVRHEFKR